MFNTQESSDLLLDEIDMNDMSLDDDEGEEDEEDLDDSTAGWRGEEEKE